MVQWVMVCLWPGHLIQEPAPVATGLFLINLPANVLGKAAEAGPFAWSWVMHMGKCNDVPGSWLGQVQLQQLQPCGECNDRWEVSLSCVYITVSFK